MSIFSLGKTARSQQQNIQLDVEYFFLNHAAKLASRDQVLSLLTVRVSHAAETLSTSRRNASSICCGIGVQTGRSSFSPTLQTM